MSTIALQTKNLTIQFGGLKAVNDLNLAIPTGTIFGLIGPNGAGKTTAFNMLTGVYCPTAGSIELFGESILDLKPYEITQKGIARTFQNIRLFKDLTVIENLIISMDNNPKIRKTSLVSAIFRSKSMCDLEKEKKEKAMELLKIFKLEHRAQWYSKNLPYGDQRRLEIARAMATGAKLLCLDEPAAGLNPLETRSLMETVRDVRDNFGMTILLIEHDMKLVMGICERIAVLDYGIKIAEGNAGEIQKDSRVIEAYLGKGH